MQTVYAFGLSIDVSCRLPFWPMQAVGESFNRISLQVSQDTNDYTWIPDGFGEAQSSVGTPTTWRGVDHNICIGWPGFVAFSIDPINLDVEAWLRAGLHKGHLGAAFGNLPIATICNLAGGVSIHAGCIVVDDLSHLFAGEAGAGKSTTVVTWLKNGAAFVSDDQTIIRGVDGGAPWTQISIPWVRLWPDGIRKLGFRPERFPRMYPETEKRIMVLKDNPLRMASSPVAVSSLNILKPIESSTMKYPEIEQIDGSEGLDVLRKYVRGGEGFGQCLASTLEERCIKLAPLIQIRRLRFDPAHHTPSVVFAYLKEVLGVSTACVRPPRSLPGG